ncbi:hypothetical protein [Alishewanella jeotgali]|uniref:Transmembrane protein n=1 Tax=Alishewanella jeotgali KCTC 22429 TaxID=1129374 RepID=H3ZH52_9ALTE|nr:hypothetical protein [Alishewanella jeotgali]EHR40192.1 hypothetical protein AJE_13510 [Alishewanella jeotgali KCTC 22429]
MEKPFQIKLIIRRVPVLSAINWLRQSWDIFKQYPLLFIQMLLLTYVVTYLATLTSLTLIIGVLASAFFTAGFYNAVAGVQQQQKIDLSWLFKPFKDASCRRSLILIAISEFLVTTVVVLLFQSQAAEAVIQFQESAIVAPSLVWQVVLLLTSVFIIKLWVCYAIAIAFFLKEQRLLLILGMAWLACWRNFGAMLVFMLLSLVLVLLSIPTMLFALVLVVPLLMISWFLSFNDIFALKLNPPREGMLEV